MKCFEGAFLRSEDDSKLFLVPFIVRKLCIERQGIEFRFFIRELKPLVLHTLQMYGKVNILIQALRTREAMVSQFFQLVTSFRFVKYFILGIPIFRQWLDLRKFNNDINYSKRRTAKKKIVSVSLCCRSNISLNPF